MNPPRVFLRDTPILLALARRGTLADCLLFHYPELKLPPDISPAAISYVTVAEMLSIAARNGWGENRLAGLHTLLKSFRVLVIDSPGVLEAYVAIDIFSLQNGRSMGKNDLWIAATASAMGLSLLTTDRDFDHLDPEYLTRIWIDPASTLSLYT